MITANDVLTLCTLIQEHGLRFWLSGGWGIVALLGEQIRPHSDLDILVPLDDVARLISLFAGRGYAIAEYCDNNLPVRDARGRAVPTNFVLRDALGCDVHVHALRMDGEGSAVPAWMGDYIHFSAEDLSAEGRLLGRRLPCISSAMQRRCRACWPQSDRQRMDLRLLEMATDHGLAH